MVFFFNDTATTEIYTLSLPDALPISAPIIASSSAAPTVRTSASSSGDMFTVQVRTSDRLGTAWIVTRRSEEHTSELQSRQYLVCRLLLEKKKQYKYKSVIHWL